MLTPLTVLNRLTDLTGSVVKITKFNYKITNFIPSSVIILCIFLYFCMTPNTLLQAQTLHALVVCDTAEYQIGISAQRDCEKIHLELDQAARHAGMKLNIQKLTGRMATPKKVYAALDKFDVKPTDTFVFYFTGHGYHPEDKLGSRWPSLYFSVVAKVVALQDVVDEILKLKPRLTLVFSDSCNTYLDTDLIGNVVYRKSVLIHPVKAYKRIMGYRQLFLNAKGLLIATAVAEGGEAEASDEGGYYTQSLLTVLHRILELGTLNVNELTWTHVMLQVRETMIREKKPIPDFHFKNG